MTKKLAQLSLLLIPIIFIVVSSLHREARGPFWLGSNYDPEYAYLINGLSLAHDGPVSHLDHPGISTKYLVAFAVRLFNPYAASDPNFIAEVLQYPDFYLTATELGSTIIITLLLLTLGVVAYRWTKSVWLSALLQTTPFISEVIPTYATARVSPEAMLVITMLLFTLLVVVMIRDQDQRKNFWYALGFAAIVAFGMITKFTFFPVAIIPVLLLIKVKYKLYYLLAIPIFFYLFSHSIIHDYSQFYDWIINRVYLGSRDTTTSSSLPDWQTLLDFTQAYVLNFRYLVATIGMSILILVVKHRAASWHSIEVRYATGVVIVHLISCILISQRPNNSYFIPALMLVVPLVFIGIQSIRQHSVGRVMAISSVVLVIIAVYETTTGMVNVLATAESDKQDQLAVYRTVESDYGDYGRVFFFRSSHPVAAVSFGYDFSGQNYDAILRSLYSREYNYGALEFNHWHDVTDLNILYDRHHGKLIFVSTPLTEEFKQSIVTQYQLTLTDVYYGQIETIYTLER